MHQADMLMREIRMPNNNPKVQFGQTLQPEPLGEWLSLVQNYAASPEALERIGVSVAALNKVQASVESLDKGGQYGFAPE
jgi:hypothetical protein